MPGDFKQTHDKILISAKQNFLEHGYERANLRKICRDAGITTGAFYRHFPDKESLFADLVDSAVQGIKKIYEVSEAECVVFINDSEINKAFQVTYKAVIGFINYIYDNFDCFKLLVMCADGTEYADFVDDLVMVEVNEREKLFEVLRKNKIEFNELRRKESHLITHSYFSSIFEVVVHDFTRKEALEYAHTLVTYNIAGLRAVLGI